MKAVTRDQMAKVDYVAFNEYKVDIMLLMENAGRLLAEFSRDILKNVKDKRIVILVGKGNNGGDGLSAARHLIDWGADANIIFASKKLGIASKKQIKLLKNFKNYRNITYSKQNNKKITGICKKSDIILDCLIGYNLKGNPTDSFKELIDVANNSKKKIIACDNPSGLDVTLGKAFDPCIKAGYTLTLALPKTGLVKKSAREYVGKLYLCDIGIPHELYKKINIKAGYIFNKKSIIRV